jgi:cytochrome c-type biogenesis protein CcmH/NrfF
VNYRPRSRGGRVLLWILLIILALIAASLLFGGFQKGTKSTLPALASAVKTSGQR